MRQLPQTRASLLLRLQTKSQDGWTEFVSLYEQSLYEFAKRKGLQHADALDVAQEVLALVENKVMAWEPDPKRGKFRGWLIRVCRNIAVDRIRERVRQPLVGGNAIDDRLASLPNREADSVEFSKSLQLQFVHYAAERVRPSISHSTWQAFWKTAIEGQPARQVAAELKMSQGNVYAAKFRVISKLQSAIQFLDNEDDSFSPETLDFSPE